MDSPPTKKELLDKNKARYANASYRETHALLIHWEDDDLKARSELRGLEFVLRDKYAVTTRLISIPTRDYLGENAHHFASGQERTFERELKQFLHLYAAPDILLIVVYLGRGNYDKDFTFTLKGARDGVAQEQTTPEIKWSVEKSGLLQALCDVVIFMDLRGITEQNNPYFDYEDELFMKGNHLNQLIISFGNPESPGNYDEPFAFTKILRDSLRSMSSRPHVAISEAFRIVTNHLVRAEDHGGLAFQPVRYQFGKFKNDIVLITFDVTTHSTNILKGVGDYKWGPMGPLPPKWVKVIDNADPYWRGYYCDLGGKCHSTRPWSSAAFSANELWDTTKFVEAAQRQIVNRLIKNPLSPDEQPSKDVHEYDNAFDDFAAGMREPLLAHLEARRLDELARKEAAMVAAAEVARVDFERREAIRIETARVETVRHQEAQAEAARAQADRIKALRKEKAACERQAKEEEAARRENICYKEDRLCLERDQEHVRIENANNEALINAKELEDQEVLGRLKTLQLQEALQNGQVPFPFTLRGDGPSQSRFATKPNMLRSPVRGRGEVKYFEPESGFAVNSSVKEYIRESVWEEPRVRVSEQVREPAAVQVKKPSRSAWDAFLNSQSGG